MRDDDRVRILHMIDAAESVGRFASGRKRRDLDNDQMLLFAIVRAIEVIGEAASKVTNETQAASPEVPWASRLAEVASPAAIGTAGHRLQSARATNARFGARIPFDIIHQMAQEMKKAADDVPTACPILLPLLDELRTYCYEHPIEEIPPLLAV